AFEVNVRWFTKKSTNERDKHQNDLESFSRMDPRKRDEYIETFGNYASLKKVRNLILIGVDALKIRTNNSSLIEYIKEKSEDEIVYNLVHNVRE
ncbi:15383_t:CDS:2, partial [Funneliformis mosseae]